MPDVIDCPSCGRKLRRPEGLAGGLAQCPKCATTFPFATDDPPPLPDEWPSEALPLARRDGDDLPLTLEDETAPPRKVKGLPPPPLPLKPVPIPAVPVVDADSPRQPCPYCGEPLQSYLRRCPSCGQRLDDDGSDEGAPLRRRDLEPHRGSLVLTLGVISICAGPTCVFSLIGLPLGVAAWIMGQADLRKINSNLMDPEGRANTHTGWICGVLGTLVSTLWLLCCGLMALR